MSTQTVTLQNDGNIAILEINNPPVNATSQSVREGLLNTLNAALANSAIEAIVIACAGKTFVAGGDIKEFGKPPLAPFLPDVVNAIEASNKPVVAALHGTTFGGGVEIALACHARIMDAKGVMSLPEVTLGIVPGSGGTQRLPRAIGLKAALDLLSTGRKIDAQEAHQIGLIDQISTHDARQEAISLARQLIGKPIIRTGEKAVSPLDETTLAASKTSLLKKSKGQIAPQKAFELACLTPTTSLSEGMKQEREAFLALMNGEQSKALRYAFFAEREVLKVPQFEGLTPATISHIGVIGLGTMGSGIAVAFALSGIKLTLIETTPDALLLGKDRVEKSLQSALKRGKLTADDFARIQSQTTYSSSLETLSDCDLVIEAIFEDMDVKQKLFAQLAPILCPNTILATNTSYLDVNALVNFAPNPTQFLGLHFFSPAHIMKLLEVVNGAQTSIQTLCTGWNLAKQIGKLPIISGVCDGFIGNRILARYRNTCAQMLLEGATPAQIDAAMEDFGMSMGPYTAQDMGGLDIAWSREKRIHLEQNLDITKTPSALLNALCEMGRYGQKTQKGWYDYSNGEKASDVNVEELIQHIAKAQNIAPKTFSSDQIAKTALEAMQDEAKKILREGIAARPEDVDIVMLHGYGFPRFRGGLFGAQ